MYHSNNTLRTVTAEKRRARTKKRAEQKTHREREREKERKKGSKRGARVFFFHLRLFHLLLSLDDDSRIGIYKTQ